MCAWPRNIWGHVEPCRPRPAQPLPGRDASQLDGREPQRCCALGVEGRTRAGAATTRSPLLPPPTHSKAHCVPNERCRQPPQAAGGWPSTHPLAVGPLTLWPDKVLVLIRKRSDMSSEGVGGHDAAIGDKNHRVHLPHLGPPPGEPHLHGWMLGRDTPIPAMVAVAGMSPPPLVSRSADLERPIQSSPDFSGRSNWRYRTYIARCRHGGPYPSGAWFSGTRWPPA